MRCLVAVLLFCGSMMGQQLFSAQDNKDAKYPEQEARSILIASCRVVGERLRIPLPAPHVELKLGEDIPSVENVDNVHVIRLRRWNRQLFKTAAVEACYLAAEFDIVPQLAKQLPK
jgi:hypothetical protein